MIHEQMKQIPPGVWLYMSRLAIGVSDVEVQEYLANRGIDLPLENISVKHYPNCTAAKISVTREVVEQLVNWAIDGEPLHGLPVRAAVVAKQ